jgi:hypothetical protein
MWGLEKGMQIYWRSNVLKDWISTQSVGCRILTSSKTEKIDWLEPKITTRAWKREELAWFATLKEWNNWKRKNLVAWLCGREYEANQQT